MWGTYWEVKGDCYRDAHLKQAVAFAWCTDGHIDHLLCPLGSCSHLHLSGAFSESPIPHIPSPTLSLWAGISSPWLELSLLWPLSPLTSHIFYLSCRLPLSFTGAYVPWGQGVYLLCLLLNPRHLKHSGGSVNAADEIGVKAAPGISREKES